MILIQRNPQLHRFCVHAIVLATSLLLATAAIAQSRGGDGPPTGIGDPRSGWMIDDIDLSERTITMAGETFQVTAMSKLQNADGKRIRLRGLRGIQSHGVADIVKFESKRIGGAGGRPEIVTLSIVNLAP